MRCCRRLADAVARLLARLPALLVLAAALATFAAPVSAAEIDVRNMQLAPAEDSGSGGYVLAADFAIDFSPRLEEAVGKGLTLHFIAEFELTRRRWYWLDEKVIRASQTWRLTYHALTRQYRLSTGGLPQSFASLDEALRVLSRLRNWQVIDRERLAPGESLDAALRLRLDTSQLPKPFQLEALSNRDWVLASDWKRWVFAVPPAVPPTSSPVAGGDAK